VNTDDVLKFLGRHFGSHDRPQAVCALWTDGRLVAGDGSEIVVDFAHDDRSVSLSALVADAWIGRNEKLPGDLDADEWSDIFQHCWWPLGDDGQPAALPDTPLTAYRCGHPNGMSWTVSADVARTFNRMRPDDPIYACTVTNELEVLAVFHGRDEHEVVLLPRGEWQSTVRLADSIADFSRTEVH
jgi:hypothetical protein